jgi:hypothetical protein
MRRVSRDIEAHYADLLFLVFHEAINRSGRQFGKCFIGWCEHGKWSGIGKSGYEVSLFKAATSVV